jgi:hypothetical protein
MPGRSKTEDCSASWDGLIRRVRMARAHVRVARYDCHRCQNAYDLNTQGSKVAVA